MLIIIEKNTREVENNMGTNSAFPDGNIPNVVSSEGEEIVRIHDKSDLAKKIMKERRKFKFTDDLKDIIITETKEEAEEKEDKLLDFQVLNELSSLDQKINRPLENLMEFVKYVPTEEEQKTIDRKKELRKKLKKNK